MRIYMSGTTDGENFIPTEIFLSNDNCDDDLSPSENCVMLSGLECECSQEGKKWSSRWKGVDLVHEADFGEEFSKEYLLSLIYNRNLRLGNMNAYIDFTDEASVTVNEIYIVDSNDDYDKGTYLDASLLTKEIEFLA